MELEVKKCCIPGCCGKENLLKFPNPEVNLDNFKAWISFIGVKASKYSNDYQKIYEEYKNRHLCNLHFTPIVYEAPNSERIIMYTVPDHYGPEFWKMTKQKIMLSLNTVKKKASGTKMKNSLSSQKKDGGNSLPITGLSNNRSSTCPRILRRRNISFATKIVPIEDILESADASKSASTTESKTRRNSQNERTPSPTDRKKPKLTNTYKEIDEMEDSEEDYEVEYLDSDTDKTDCEENTHHEIEYLDMNKLDAYDQQITTTNTIKDVTVKRASEATKTQSNDIQETTKPNSIEISTSNTYNEISSVTDFNSEINKTNGRSNDIQETIKPSTIEISTPNTHNDIPLITDFNSEVNKTYNRRNDIQETRKPNTIEISIPDFNSEVNKTYGRKCKIFFEHKINTVKTVSKETSNVYKEDYAVTVDENSDAGMVVQDIEKALQQENERNASNFMPVLEVDSTNGRVNIKLVQTEMAAGISDPKLDEQPTKKANKTSELPQRTKQTTSQSLDSNALKEFMSKHNLKPIDTKTPLHKHMSTTITQLQKEYEVKLPVEITNQNVQKLLAPSSSQHSTDSKTAKTTNVYVLDSKGSILVKEQLDLKHKPQVHKPVGTVNETPTQKNPVAQESENKFSKSKVELATERALQLELNKTKKTLALLKYKHKARAQKNRNLLMHPKFIKVTNKMARIPRMITTIQLRESLKSSKGRRFTDEEKELVISLHDQCPSAYKYMQKMGFILPRYRYLTKRDVKADVESAINRNDAVTKLKAKIDKMPAEYRLCTLLFDEKLISPSNRNKLVTAIGIQEEAEATVEADHALIFMVKGILQNYQEPVSYTFSFGPTNAQDLAFQITSVISDLQSVGYKVLATICDQADNNRMAIEILTNTKNYVTSNKICKLFKVNNDEIIPIYDPPHLLKGIRNHLISKQLVFEMDGQMKKAQWQHLEMILRENPNYNGERLIAKLTENHVYPTKQGIGKTKYACQIFSQTIATYMGYLAEKDILPPQSCHTADLLLFFDQLFDSLNGHLDTPKKGKLLLSAVKSKSEHHKIWAEAILVLKTMKFVNNKSVINVADIHCWIWTLEGFMLLMRKLFLDLKVESVWMRNMNQDVLERLFRIEVNPTPSVRSKNTAKHKKMNIPGRFPGEVVTQKVIKAINRINRQENIE